MLARTYLLTADNTLTLTDLTGASLDAVSLNLPDGIYTTMRTYERENILGLSAHLQRLTDSLVALAQDRPVNAEIIRQALRDVIELENQPDLRLRLTLPFNRSDVFISVEPFAPFPPEFYTQGVRVATSRLSRATPAAKYTAFIGPSRSEKGESDPAVHELLMVNGVGEILEGLSSNFYGVLSGVLRTAGEGVLAGVTRGVVLASAESLIKVDRRPVHLSEVNGLAEAFITSAGREVMPVRQIDDVVIGDPGPVTNELLARYRAHIKKDAEKP